MKPQATRTSDVPLYPWYVEAGGVLAFLLLVWGSGWIGAQAGIPGWVMASIAIPSIIVLLIVLAVILLKDEE